ncbi:hypothetical protein [uncultured Campylobacter sp.]|uniref:hypothetical protein n=1 Tax=uncultured Campylobacter sp. TaxID=218934 RepID=UPI00261DEAC4|nr:hypothetical protein [uncultured Campylobacter sp.]
MRFLVFIFAFLFIAAIFFVRDEILSKRAKIIATALIVLLCAGAYFYESASERSAKLEEEMVFKFNAGARLRCGGAINSASETRGADAKNLGSQAGEVNLNAQDKVASAAQANDTQSSAAQTNEQASAAQTSGAVSGGQNSAQSPTSQNSTQQNDTQSLAPQNSMRQSDTQISDPQGSAQNSKATQNFAADKEQGSAQIVTRESFTYSFSLGAFIAKKSAGAEFKGKTYKIKECVYDQ